MCALVSGVQTCAIPICIAYRNVDPLPDLPNLARIQRRADVADAIFLTSASPLHGVPPDSRARVYFMPNPIDPAIDVGRSFSRSDPAHALFFALAGAAARLRPVTPARQPLPPLTPGRPAPPAPTAPP